MTPDEGACNQRGTRRRTGCLGSSAAISSSVESGFALAVPQLGFAGLRKAFRRLGADPAVSPFRCRPLLALRAEEAGARVPPGGSGRTEQPRRRLAERRYVATGTAAATVVLMERPPPFSRDRVPTLRLTAAAGKRAILDRRLSLWTEGQTVACPSVRECRLTRRSGSAPPRSSASCISYDRG
jgi:hypothetical protein